MVEDEVISVADRHYKAIVSGDKGAWAETLVERYRIMVGVRGSSPDFWWRAGARMAEKGVEYRFHHVEWVEGDHAKLFYERVDREGRRMGLPVPIYLEREMGEWRVSQPTY